MRSNSGIISRLDWVIVLVYFLLILIGWLNIYAANYVPEHPSIFDTSREYGMQFIWLVLGTMIGYVLLLFDGDFYRRNALFIYLGVIVLLVAVLLFGREVNGATSWFRIGGFGLQPSEFAKLGTALAVGAYLDDVNIKLDKFRALLVTIGLLAIPSLLIILQPDAGTLLVFLGFSFVMYREGLLGNIIFLAIGLVFMVIVTLSLIQTRFPLFIGEATMSGSVFLTLMLLLSGGLGFFFVQRFVRPRFRKDNIRSLVVVIGSAILSVWALTGVYDSGLLADHHRSRIDVLFGHMEDPSGAGYNVVQSKTAIGSGGFAGKGFLKGVLTKYKYVPMQSTDFIFCTVGEEWGFIGTSVVIILFMILLLRIIHIAERQRSRFTRVFAYAVACIFFMHILINIGMAIGLAPVIGIPLPFFSYGGSSFLGFSAMIFILLRLDSERLEVFR